MSRPPILDYAHQKLQPCTVRRRARALIHDLLTLIGWWIAVTVFIGGMQSGSGLLTLCRVPLNLQRLTIDVLEFLVPAVVQGALYLVAKQTIGMNTLKLKAICQDGTPPSALQMLARALAAVPSWTLGAVSAIVKEVFSRKAVRMWHDKLTKTAVVACNSTMG